MSRQAVIAEIVDPGSCRYYCKGHRIQLTGFTPAGMCDSAYAVLSRDAQTLGYGGKLPWQTDGILLTHCPDPKGATWRLQVAPTGLREKHNSKESLKPEDFVDFSVCRGMNKSCRFSLKIEPWILRDVKWVVWNSPLIQLLMERSTEKPKPHGRLRIGMAACPNACSLPQTKAIGLIARHKPDHIDPGCNGCGACVDRCTEEALKMNAEKVEFEPQRCVGCGLCLDACANSLIKAEELAFEIVVGGMMGRHPRLAQSLGFVHPDQAASAVSRVLDLLSRNVQDGLSIPQAFKQIDISSWQNCVFHDHEQSTPLTGSKIMRRNK